jgi:Bardet-Biedl syndrome 9 protein
MSIFEVKEWWSTNISKDEEFDGNSVCIDNIDNENLNKNKICVSSFKGILRIYEPTFGSTRVDNLLFEKQLDMPIIQIGSGNFVINANDKQLAVLQAKKLIVYQFYNLRTGVSTKTCYEHKLVRNAFNFCIGRIGEKNYDFIFVQSVDGVISIFEQDAIVNHVSLNEVIFPGPIGFLSRKDHLLVSNTAYEVECYSYNNLATTNSKSEGKIMYTWSYNLGELVREIKIIDNKITKKQEIMIITETMLHLLEDNGKILFQKKLDFEPMSVYVYNIEDSNYSANKNINLMYAISTDSDHILVYKGLNLVWAAKVHDTPVFLKLADFDGTKGLLTTLSDTGSLNVMYLGMTPAKNSKMYIPGKTLDIDNVVKETDRLSEIIENYERGVVIIPKDTLTLTADINRELCADDYYFEDKIYHCDTLGKILRSQVKLTFAFDGLEAENIKITIITPYNVVCDDHSFTIERLTSHNSPFSRIINFRVLNQYFPTYTNVKVYATYFIKSKDILI